MRTWAEFTGRQNEIPDHMERTDVECPRCGGGTPLYCRTDIVLATYPPEFRYECLKCGWYGTAHR